MPLIKPENSQFFILNHIAMIVLQIFLTPNQFFLFLLKSLKSRTVKTNSRTQRTGSTRTSKRSMIKFRMSMKPPIMMLSLPTWTSARRRWKWSYLKFKASPKNTQMILKSWPNATFFLPKSLHSTQKSPTKLKSSHLSQSTTKLTTRWQATRWKKLRQSSKAKTRTTRKNLHIK